MKIGLALVLCLSAGLVFAQTAPAKPGDAARCTKANNLIVVNNLFPNWKYDSASLRETGNSCTLEKKDSVPNDADVNTQIQIMFSDRKYVSTPLGPWADQNLSDVRQQEGVSDVKMVDVTFSGKAAKKITYRKKWDNYDKTKSVSAGHEDYYIVEPAYAVSVMTYVPEPDSAKARPEMEKILKGIELK